MIFCQLYLVEERTQSQSCALTHPKGHARIVPTGDITFLAYDLAWVFVNIHMETRLDLKPGNNHLLQFKQHSDPQVKHIPAKSKMNFTAMTRERSILKLQLVLIPTDSYHVKAQHQYIQMPQLTTD